MYNINTVAPETLYKQLIARKSFWPLIKDSVRALCSCLYFWIQSWWTQNPIVAQLAFISLQVARNMFCSSLYSRELMKWNIVKATWSKINWVIDILRPLIDYWVYCMHKNFQGKTCDSVSWPIFDIRLNRGTLYHTVYYIQCYSDKIHIRSYDQ